MEKNQLSMLVNTRRYNQVRREIRRIIGFHYRSGVWKKVKKTCLIAQRLFAGKLAGYRACNTHYHDFFHTTDTLLAACRLIDGYNIENGNNPLTGEQAARMLQAALLHDTGYIQREWDTLGTGAKYTREHVERSKEFVRENSRGLGFSEEDIVMVTRAIDSTGMAPQTVVLAGDDERDGACSVLLGAADLIAQMADRTYLEKLLFLYYEFREAGIPGYETEFDIIRKTLEFFETATGRLDGDFKGVHRAVRAHFAKRFGIDADLYSEAINRNMDYIRKIIQDATTNFRHKLHRVSL